MNINKLCFCYCYCATTCPYAGLLVRYTKEFISLVVSVTVSYTTTCSTGLSDGLFDTSCLFQQILANTSVNVDDTIAVSINVTVTLTAIGLVQSMK